MKDTANKKGLPGGSPYGDNSSLSEPVGSGNADHIQIVNIFIRHPHPFQADLHFLVVEIGAYAPGGRGFGGGISRAVVVNVVFAEAGDEIGEYHVHHLHAAFGIETDRFGDLDGIRWDVVIGHAAADAGFQLSILIQVATDFMGDTEQDDDMTVVVVVKT